MKRINISSGEDAFHELQNVNYDYTHNIEVQTACGSNSNNVALHTASNNVSLTDAFATRETQLRRVY